MHHNSKRLLRELDMRSCVLIPARFKSSRFPGKPLALINGKPMIIWVAELASKAVGSDNVFIATDDERIGRVVAGAGYQYIMTSANCLTGTDRIAEAAHYLDYEIIINVQGDEPIASPEDILKCIDLKAKNMNAVINGFAPLSESEKVDDNCIPKVAMSRSNKLLYISRSPLPGCKSIGGRPSAYFKQVCIYGFSKYDLFLFSEVGEKSPLELYEDIEILRFLEIDRRVIMFECKSGSIAVDRPEDIIKVENSLRLRTFDG